MTSLTYADLTAGQTTTFPSWPVTRQTPTAVKPAGVIPVPPAGTSTQKCTEGLMAGMRGGACNAVADRLLQPWLFLLCRDRAGTLDGSSVTDPPLQAIRKVTLALARRCRPIRRRSAGGGNLTSVPSHPERPRVLG